MTQFQLTIECDNAAFEDEPTEELARILKGISEHVGRGNTENVVFDINGNNVGSYCFEQ